MNVDWSNVGKYSRSYGWALDHNLSNWMDPDFIKFLVGSWLALHTDLSELIEHIDIKSE